MDTVAAADAMADVEVNVDVDVCLKLLFHESRLKTNASITIKAI